MVKLPITERLPAGNAELEWLPERAESLQVEADISVAQWNSLEQFLEHERQEIDTLNCLAAALEAHRRVMDELADALRLLRENLFSQEDL
jgi:hypothetical protein